jgi:hypothetical protein
MTQATRIKVQMAAERHLAASRHSMAQQFELFLVSK